MRVDRKCRFVGRYVFTVVACVLVICIGLEVRPAEPSDEAEQVNVTQWIDPTGRKPITLAEWATLQPQHSTALTTVAESTLPGPSAIRVLIRDAIFGALETEIVQYYNDLTVQGFTVSVLVGDFASPAALRTWLQAEYASSEILGVVIIGDWPVPWFEMDDDFSEAHAEFPCDLYYMDLDGSWADADGDGMFDAHFSGYGDVGPEIWVGRLTFSPLTHTGASEVQLLSAYLDKVHNYRMGTLCRNTQALIFNDDDWDTGFDTCGEVDLCLTYGASGATFVTDREATTADQYKEHVVQNREFIHVMSHGSPGGHGFKENGGADFSWVSYEDVLNLDPQAAYYNLFICSSCRYVETDYVGGWYINSSKALAAVGSTKTGSMLLFPEFYAPLSTGATLGEAFKSWFEGRASNGFELWERQWFYGMTLLGDPTLGPRVSIPDPYEPNNTCETAYDIGVHEIGDHFESAVASFFDSNEDWFTLDVSSSGQLLVETQPVGAAANPEVWLYDTCGAKSLEPDGGYGSLTSEFRYSVTSGSYFLRLDQYSSQYGPCTQYTFSIALQPVPSIAVLGTDQQMLQTPIGTVALFPDVFRVGNTGQAETELSYRIWWQELASSASAGQSSGDQKLDLSLKKPSDESACVPSAAAPSGNWDLLCLDPDEAGDSVGDFAELYGQIDGTTLYFRGVMHRPWTARPEDVGVAVLLDTDQDSLTGWDFLGLGVEYYLVMYAAQGSSPASGGLYGSDGESDWYLGPVDYLGMPASADEFVVGIDLIRLGSDYILAERAGGTDIVFYSIDFELQIEDIAPDAGYVSYPGAHPFITFTPNSGSLGSGQTVGIDAHVDSTDPTSFGLHRIRLYFVSNDSTTVPTRDVLLTIETPAVFRVEAESGNVYADESLHSAGLGSGHADVAEWVLVTESVDSGDVLELDPACCEAYCKSKTACSSLIAGVVSTAPGVTLGASDDLSQHAILALAGIVPVRVTNEGGFIQPGDLLVSSSTAGHAMRWAGEGACPCALVGKALEPMTDEAGMILVLLTAH